MGFASAWLGRGAIFPPFITGVSGRPAGIIVVVPACNEDGITVLLDSLASCRAPHRVAEVIIVVNSPADAAEEIRQTNRRTIEDIESWKKQNTHCFFRLFSFIVEDPPVRKWGVGLARKTGMDEALRRFDAWDDPGGIIVNLDADCKVDPGYFVSIEDEFEAVRGRNAASIYFEHPVSGAEFPDYVYSSIIQYEIHLRYFVRALVYAGFPYAFHTVGSSFAVRAGAYVGAGGMNRRQAGEDFYFIQKLMPPGGYFNITGTTVYPSPRPSMRVPFGTGATITRLSESRGASLYSYNLRAFRDLKILFALARTLYDIPLSMVSECYSALPESIRSFVTEREWSEKITEIKLNTSGPLTFVSRFFAWFNMFAVVKFMNTVHREGLLKEQVVSCSSELLSELGINHEPENPYDILLKYRQLDRES